MNHYDRVCRGCSNWLLPSEFGSGFCCECTLEWSRWGRRITLMTLLTFTAAAVALSWFLT